MALGMVKWGGISGEIWCTFSYDSGEMGLCLAMVVVRRSSV